MPCISVGMPHPVVERFSAITTFTTRSIVCCYEQLETSSLGYEYIIIVDVIGVFKAKRVCRKMYYLPCGKSSILHRCKIKSAHITYQGYCINEYVIRLWSGWKRNNCTESDCIWCAHAHDAHNRRDSHFQHFQIHNSWHSKWNAYFILKVDGEATQRIDTRNIMCVIVSIRVCIIIVWVSVDRTEDWVWAWNCHHICCCLYILPIPCWALLPDSEPYWPMGAMYSILMYLVHHFGSWFSSLNSNGVETAYKGWI